MGNLAFVWYERATGLAKLPDPKFISFKAVWAQHDNEYLPMQLQPVVLDQITRERYSQYMTEGSYFEFMEKFAEGGQTNILTVKDPSNYTLVDAVDARTANYLSFQVLKCEKETSGVECADFGENGEHLEAYLQQFSFGVINLLNFIDHGDEVEPFEGPIKFTDTWVRVEPLTLPEKNQFKMFVYSFVEQRITLEDSLFQIRSDPAKFELLNLDKRVLEVTYPQRKNYLALFNFGLGQEVKVEQRRVLSIPVLFGSVVGLQSFVIFFAGLLLEPYTDTMKSLSQVSLLYRKTKLDNKLIDESKAQDLSSNITLRPQVFVKLSLTFFQRFRQIFLRCCFCIALERDRKIKRFVDKGQDKLSKALDIRKIVYQQRYLNTLLRLEFRHVARSLMRLQRRETVIMTK